MTKVLRNNNLVISQNKWRKIIIKCFRVEHYNKNHQISSSKDLPISNKKYQQIIRRENLSIISKPKIRLNRLPDHHIVLNLSNTLLTHLTKTINLSYPIRTTILSSKNNMNNSRGFNTLQILTNLNLTTEMTIMKTVWENLSLPIVLNKQLYPKLQNYQKHHRKS